MKSYVSFVFASVFTGILMTTPLLDAQVVPYKASGTNAQFNPFAEFDSNGIPIKGTYSGSGKGTHLGRHQIEGEIFYGVDFVLNFDATGRSFC